MGKMVARRAAAKLLKKSKRIQKSTKFRSKPNSSYEFIDENPNKKKRNETRTFRLLHNLIKRRLPRRLSAKIDAGRKIGHKISRAFKKNHPTSHAEKANSEFTSKTFTEACVLNTQSQFAIQSGFQDLRSTEKDGYDTLDYHLCLIHNSNPQVRDGNTTYINNIIPQDLKNNTSHSNDNLAYVTPISKNPFQNYPSSNISNYNDFLMNRHVINDSTTNKQPQCNDTTCKNIHLTKESFENIDPIENQNGILSVNNKTLRTLKNANPFQKLQDHSPITSKYKIDKIYSNLQHSNTTMRSLDTRKSMKNPPTSFGNCYISNYDSRDSNPTMGNLDSSSATCQKLLQNPSTGLASLYQTNSDSRLSNPTMGNLDSSSGACKKTMMHYPSPSLDIRSSARCPKGKKVSSISRNRSQVWEASLLRRVIQYIAHLKNILARPNYGQDDDLCLIQNEFKTLTVK